MFLLSNKAFSLFCNARSAGSICSATGYKQSEWTLYQNFPLETTERDLVLVDELIKCLRNLIAIRDPVLPDYFRGQAGQPRVADGVDELVDLLALKKRPKSLSVMVFSVLKWN